MMFVKKTGRHVMMLGYMWHAGATQCDCSRPTLQWCDRWRIARCGGRQFHYMRVSEWVSEWHRTVSKTTNERHVTRASHACLTDAASFVNCCTYARRCHGYAAVKRCYTPAFVASCLCRRRLQHFRRLGAWTTVTVCRSLSQLI